MITMVDISELYDNNNLVGGFYHLETYEGQWEGLSHILWKNNKCLKPPTSNNGDY